MKLAAAAIAGVIAFTSFASASANEELDRLFAEYWANELEENPYSATYNGDNDYNAVTPSVTPKDEARRTAEAKAFLSKLDAVEMNGATEDDRLNASLLRFVLKHRIALAAFDGWRIPFLSDSGFQNDFSFVVDATPFETEKDYENYIERLKGLPGYLDQNVANMRLGIKDGFTQPREIMAGILPQFEAQIAPSVSESPFFAPFAEMPPTISKKRAMALRAEGERIIRDEVMPAYQRTFEFMRDEYAPNAADKIGAGALPNGEAYYEALVRYYTTRDDVTADMIHKTGLKEVARIRKEMDEVIKKTGFKGDFPAFLEFLRTDPQFYAETPEALLERAAYLSKTIDGKLPGYFGKLPRQPYSVEAVPAEIAPNYTSARYVGAAPGAKRGGRYWVNTYALDKRPLYELPALTLHEAVPGHHLQNALSYEVENAPEFRKQLYPHAFGEGWGLYSEKLGVEMGVYQTPYDEFGRLSMEMWRACRLVIDTGIHSKGWARQQALDYLAGNTALSLKNVQVEVDRYIAWPGQALAYKMGELTILELRRKAEKALGDKFDIREFHDVVLDQGGLPLAVLTEQVDAYIARKK